MYSRKTAWQVFQSARSSVLDSEEDPTDYTWTEAGASMCSSVRLHKTNSTAHVALNPHLSRCMMSRTRTGSSGEDDGDVEVAILMP